MTRPCPICRAADLVPVRSAALEQSGETELPAEVFVCPGPRCSSTTVVTLPVPGAHWRSSYPPSPPAAGP